MAAYNLTKRAGFNVWLLAAFLMVGTQVVSAQFNVRGLSIPKPKHPTTDKTDPPSQPETTSDTTKTPTSSNSKPAPKKETDVRISLFLDDIKKQQHDVEIYDPNERLYLVARTQDNYLLMSISPKARKEFLTKWSSANGVEQLNPALDSLGAAAALKLPTYVPAAKNFAFHSPVEEKLMRGALENIASLKISKIGVAEGSWLIDKNGLGIPTARYKHGAIWARDTNDDHPYCHVYWVNIIQDYAGGGTYGASHAELEYDELFGCQAGAK